MHLKRNTGSARPKIQLRSRFLDIRSWKPTCFERGESVETMMMISETISAPRLLLVDDEIHPLELRAEIMKLHGFSVLTADSPIKVIAMLTGEAIKAVHIAILDYNMPGMNGCVLAARLRSVLPDLRIILYSGELDIPRAEMRDIDALVSKSDGIGCLIDQVAQFAEPPMTPALFKTAYFNGTSG
jgi:CheY-like chemotaxis protein